MRDSSCAIRDQNAVEVVILVESLTVIVFIRSALYMHISLAYSYDSSEEHVCVCCQSSLAFCRLHQLMTTNDFRIVGPSYPCLSYI